jgi:hypothetical protein
VSWENLKDAYRTRLGNLTAKSVLVLIVDEANAEGLAFVGLDRVASLTEINKRTTLRIVQVFGEIDLVNRTEASLRGRVLPAFQVNLAKLGLDLAADFSRAYVDAQRKLSSTKCLSDMSAGVAATLADVAATCTSVAATLPPHPLLGGPLLFPLKSPHPQTPSLREGADASRGLELAVDQVSSALAIANRRKRKLLRNVIALECEKGEKEPTVALALIAACRKKAEMGRFLCRCSLTEFLGEGLWKDEQRWPWNQMAIREEQLRAEARVGSVR